MPVFQNCGFVDFKGCQLESCLPELPSDPNVLDLVRDFLRISASQRLDAKTASQNPWLKPIEVAKLGCVKDTLKAHLGRKRDLGDDVQ